MCQARSTSGFASGSGFGSECLSHSLTRTHLDTDTSHTPWRATPRPSATLTSRPLSSPCVQGARATRAGAAQSPEPRSHRVRRSGSCVPPCGGLEMGSGSVQVWARERTDQHHGCRARPVPTPLHVLTA